MIANANLKPYVLNAFCQWCYDNNYIPLITVAYSENNVLPKSLENKTHVFNLSARAIQKLDFIDDGITFFARFNTLATEVFINYKSILNITCQETGYALDFGSIMLLSEAKKEIEKQKEPNNNINNKENNLKKENNFEIVKEKKLKLVSVNGKNINQNNSDIKNKKPLKLIVDNQENKQDNENK